MLMYLSQMMMSLLLSLFDIFSSTNIKCFDIDIYHLMSWLSFFVFLCQQKEHWFEQALKEKRGFIIKRMGEDGACLFRSVGSLLQIHFADVDSI